MMQWLPSLSDKYPDSIPAIQEVVRNGTLQCKSRIVQPDGDIRHWDVSPDADPLINDFQKSAVQLAESIGGIKNAHVILMLNYISAEVCQNGSGGGWHVDSVRPQYKLFCYLTDCLSEETGPFCLLKHSSSLVERAAVIANRLVGGGRRFSEGWIKGLEKIGFRRRPVLAAAGKPFFVGTNRIHRGLSITQGERMMLTAYIYNGEPPQSILNNIM